MNRLFVSRPRRSARGFTLLELLTVMAIMFILMSMALGAYFGLVRGTAISGARDNLVKTLALARQHAVTHRTRVYVLFDQATGVSGDMTYSYEVVAQAGLHEFGNASSDLVVRNPRWGSDDLVGGAVYNLTAGSRVTNIVANEPTFVKGALSGGSRQVWNIADRYGWLIHDTEFLPTTLMFDGDPDDVVFQADGTTERAGGADYEIKMKEIRGPGTLSITVNAMTGLAQALD